MTSHSRRILNVRVTKNIYSIAMILVTLLSHFLNSNSSLISASIFIFCNYFGMRKKPLCKKMPFFNLHIFIFLHKSAYMLTSVSKSFCFVIFSNFLGIFIPDKRMCKPHSKMLLNFKIGLEMTEKFNFQNALAQAEIEN